MIHRLTINTKSRVESHDLTAQICEIVSKSGIKEGMCYVLVPHTTAGLIINENADPDVVRDILAHLDRMVPQEGNYRHIEGNSPAHIKACLVGCAKLLPIEDGRLLLGTWQGLHFCEFDGPRQRKVLVKLFST